MNKTLFLIGLLIVITAAALLLFRIIPFGTALALAIVGNGLIVLSRRKERKKPKFALSEQVVQTVHSADGQMRAMIKQRADGNYQVEIQRLVHEDSQEYGQSDYWVRQSAPITDTLSSAVDIAVRHVRPEE
jgi:ATP-dependent 26S proteasome regulatory subunit